MRRRHFPKKLVIHCPEGHITIIEPDKPVICGQCNYVPTLAWCGVTHIFEPSK